MDGWHGTGRERDNYYLYRNSERYRCTVVGVNWVGV